MCSESLIFSGVVAAVGDHCKLMRSVQTETILCSKVRAPAARAENSTDQVSKVLLRRSECLNRVAQAC